MLLQVSSFEIAMKFILNNRYIDIIDTYGHMNTTH